MNALYAMQYASSPGGFGVGAIYVGKGQIIGLDAGNGRYHGTYTEAGGRIKGKITLSAPKGATLVTGQKLEPGQSLTLEIDWPSTFGEDGKLHQVMVAGNPVQVAFEKIGDIA